MGIWNFIQNQVLGMKWLNELVGFALSALGLDVTGRIGGSIQFFIYYTKLFSAGTKQANFRSLSWHRG